MTNAAERRKKDRKKKKEERRQSDVTHLEKREVSFDRQESTFDKSNDAS